MPVCRSWRHVVFASPRRLNLQLYCTERRPVREMLDVWPALPIVIWNSVDQTSLVDLAGADNIIAALEHNDRLYEVNLGIVPNWLLKRLAVVMEGPFPSLTSLVLYSNDEPAPLFPESFLGGSAPRLRSLRLDNVPIPVLRDLSLTASNLVDLCLLDIPHSAYISPEAMLACLAPLTAPKRLISGSIRLNPDPIRQADAHLRSPVLSSPLSSLVGFMVSASILRISWL